MQDNPYRSDGCPDPRARAPATHPSLTPAPAWVDDQVVEVRASLHISAPATGHTAARARREFVAWLAMDVATGELFDDLVLAVYEALANTVEHAYRDTSTGSGPVQLRVRRSHAALHVTVTDSGTWRDAPVAPTFRGRGLPLIRQLVHDVHIQTSSTGTIVSMRASLPPAPR